MWRNLFRDVIVFHNKVVTTPPVCSCQNFLSNLECTLWRDQAKILYNGAMKKRVEKSTSLFVFIYGALTAVILTFLFF